MAEEFDLSKIDVPVRITAEQVLDQLDELLIYRYYLGPFSLGKKMKHPFRKDEHPSFAVFFGTKLLKLLWKDFGTNKSGDVFSLIATMFKLSYYEAVLRVAADFGLLTGQPIVTKRQIQEARAFTEEFQKKEYLIQVERRAMNAEELAYWAQYSITRKDLLANHIFGIEKLWINKRLMHLNQSTLHFAYHFPEVDKWKIYSPYDSDYKWFGNVSTFQMEGLEDLTLIKMKGDQELPGDPIIVIKSRKDRIILKKLYSNTCSCQNESEGAIPREMDVLFDQCEAKYCWFDSDEPGKNANRKLNHRGYKWINVPNELYEKYKLKDPSDIIKHFGWDEGSKILLNELKKKNLL